jgi:light-independent protochlorophyllide reductase subunit B
MGFEGANVIFDTWVHPLMMGLEEHLLSMFREDFEFADGVGPSHLGAHAAAARPPAAVAEAVAVPAPVIAAPPPVPSPAAVVAAEPAQPAVAAAGSPAIDKNNWWMPEAEKELKKIPFFVRGKARRNTERFAQERGLDRITLETLYDAKAHFRS